MELSDLIIQSDEIGFEPMLTNWDWLTGGSFRPIFMTAFGDWFLTDLCGKVHVLDMLEGRVVPVAKSEKDIDRVFASEKGRDKWLLEGFVMSLRQGGVVRPRGQCYAWQVHPAIGGKLEVPNIILLGLNVWQMICSQIHYQLRDLAPGTRIVRLEASNDGSIRLITG